MPRDLKDKLLTDQMDMMAVGKEYGVIVAIALMASDGEPEAAIEVLERIQAKSPPPGEFMPGVPIPTGYDQAKQAIREAAGKAGLMV